MNDFTQPRDNFLTVSRHINVNVTANRHPKMALNRQIARVKYGLLGLLNLEKLTRLESKVSGSNPGRSGIFLPQKA